MRNDARSTAQAWVITIVAGVMAVWAPAAVSYALTTSMMTGHSPPFWYIGFSLMWGLAGLAILFVYGMFAPAPALWGPPVVVGAASLVSGIASFFWFSGGVTMMQGGGAFTGVMVAAMVFGLLWGVAVGAGVTLGGAAFGRSRRDKRAMRAAQEPPSLPSFERVE